MLQAGLTPRPVYFSTNRSQSIPSCQQHTMGLYTGLTPSKAEGYIHLQLEETGNQSAHMNVLLCTTL